MRRGIDAQRQSADDAQPVVAQIPGKRFGIHFPLRRGVTAADNRHRRLIQKIEAAFDVKQGRRIGNLQQGLRVFGVGQGDDMVVFIVEPGGEQGQRIRVNAATDALSDVLADNVRQGCVGCGVNLFRFAEGAQQLAVRLVAQSRNQA